MADLPTVARRFTSKLIQSHPTRRGGGHAFNIAPVAAEILEQRVLLSAPDAVNDSYAITHDTPLSDNVTWNDSNDPDGGGITASLDQGPSHGTVQLDADGAFTYTPDQGWVGTDTFTYTISDSFGSDQAAVTIGVGNTAPDAQNDNFAITHDMPLSDTVGSNDTDAEADGLTYTLIGGPSSGQLVFNDDGTFEFTPDHLFVGTVTFTYQATDGIATSAIATVTIAIGNSAPTFDEIIWYDTGEIEVAADSLIFEDGMILGWLGATDAEADGLVYSSTNPSPYLEVTTAGEIVVTDGAGLTAYFVDNDGLQIPVSVTDGIASVASQFVLNKKANWVDQSEIYVQDSQGTEYTPQNAAALITVLQNILNNGDTVTTLIIKGHGWDTGIDVGDSGGMLTVEGGVVRIGDTDVTQLFQDVTDVGTTISLRGCFSYPLAKRLEQALDGAHAYDAVRFVFGIPGTTWGIGIYR